MSPGERDAEHCPHCGGELPEPDTGEQAAIAFCPSCGRRVEGWRTGFRASIGGANAPVTTPGGEEPTRAIAPSASLLRAAIAAEAEKAEKARPTEVITAPKKPGSPIALLGMIFGAAALVIGALVVLGKPHRPPPPIVRPAPTIVPQADSPPVATPPLEPPPVAPVATKLPLVAPPTVATTKEAVKPPAKEPAKAPVKDPVKPPAPKVATGGLPHKTSKTDSRPVEQTGQSGTSTPVANAPMVPPPSVPPPLVGSKEPEQAAQTPQQLEQARHDEGASQADAQNVRFVVQAHIAQVQACYSRAFKDSSPGGRIDIGFLIGANGRATKVRTEQNATKSTVLSSCLEHLVEGWQFVRPAAGQLELIYPFVFTPGA